MGPLNDFVRGHMRHYRHRWAEDVEDVEECGLIYARFCMFTVLYSTTTTHAAVYSYDSTVKCKLVYWASRPAHLEQGTQHLSHAAAISILGSQTLGRAYAIL